MKLGITTQPFLLWEEERYRKLSALGVQCADVDFASTALPLYVCSEADLRAQMAQEAKLAADSGIEISQVHGPWRWPPRDATPEDRAERMGKMRRCLHATALLGCKYMVIHPIMPFGIEDLGTENAPVTWEMNLEFMRSLLETAEAENITICLENMPMPKFSIGSPKAILEFVEQINHPLFQICLDTGHAAICCGSKFGDEVRALGSHLRVLHVHDNDGIGDRHQMPTTGIIDWQDFRKSLDDIGFDGAFSIEMGPAKDSAEFAFCEEATLILNIGKNMCK